MNKFKVGDKVKRVRDVEPFLLEHDGDTGVVSKVYDPDYIQVGDYLWNPSCFEIANQEWSIYNNDKPLSELSDKQVGKLVKHCGEIEHMNKNTLTWGLVMTPSWNKGEVYRAKQK